MSLKYKAKQSTLETKEGKKLWYPTLVLDETTIDLKKIAARIVSKSSLSVGDVYNVVYSLLEEMNDNLLRGNSVCLDTFGTFRVVARAGGNGVETPEEVNASQIKSLRVQFTPTSTHTPYEGTTRAMLRGAELVRWKGDPYHPDNRKTDGNDTGNGNNNGGNWQDPDS